jgi:hypothetical protein
MVRDIIKLILDAFIYAKSSLHIDIDWGILFLFLLAATGGLRYLAGKYAKSYDAEALKKKWFGLGRGLLFIHAGKNRLLKWGLAVSSVCFVFAFVTVGSQTNGAIADAGSSMTNLETGEYLIAMNCGVENGKQVVYCHKLTINESGAIVKMPNGTVFKAGEMEVANGTSLGQGTYIEVSLANGETLISGLNETQARARLLKNDSWYATAKRSLASVF